MEIFVAMIDDKHSSTEPYPFTTAQDAIDYARGQAHELAAYSGAEVIESPVEDWLYHAEYGENSVWVVAKTIPTDTASADDADTIESFAPVDGSWYSDDARKVFRSAYRVALEQGLSEAAARAILMNVVAAVEREMESRS